MKLHTMKMLTSVVLIIGSTAWAGPHDNHGNGGSNSTSNTSNILQNSQDQTSDVDINSDIHSDIELESDVDIRLDVEIDKQTSNHITNNYMRGNIVLNGKADMKLKKHDVLVLNDQNFKGTNSSRVDATGIEVAVERTNGNFNTASVSSTAVGNNLSVSVGNQDISQSGKRRGLGNILNNNGKYGATMVMSSQLNSGENSAMLLMNSNSVHQRPEVEIEDVAGSFNVASVSASAVGNSVSVNVANVSVATANCGGCN